MTGRRDLLTGVVGACAGVACWTVGSAVTDEIQTTSVQYIIIRNNTASQQSLNVLFESDEEPVVWETHDLASGQAVELDGFDPVGDYRLSVQWDGKTASQRLETGRRAVAIVVASVWDGNIFIQDVPSSSVSSGEGSTNVSEST